MREIPDWIDDEIVGRLAMAPREVVSRRFGIAVDGDAARRECRDQLGASSRDPRPDGRGRSPGAPGPDGRERAEPRYPHLAPPTSLLSRRCDSIPRLGD